MKSKKKKNADKKTLEQRFVALNDLEKGYFVDGIMLCDPNEYDYKSGCCPGFTMGET